MGLASAALKEAWLYDMPDAGGLTRGSMGSRRTGRDGATHSECHQVSHRPAGLCHC